MTVGPLYIICNGESGIMMCINWNIAVSSIPKLLWMESGDSSSSDSSASGLKPRPVGGASEDDSDGMVYRPPHFPQRQRNRSGSNFSPHSEDSSEDEAEESSSSREEVRGQPVAPPISIRTYAPPPNFNDVSSDHDSVSDMEPGHSNTLHHVSISYQSSRHRQVNYKEFYSESEERNAASDSEEDVGWKRRRNKKVSSY